MVTSHNDLTTKAKPGKRTAAARERSDQTRLTMSNDAVGIGIGNNYRVEVLDLPWPEATGNRQARKGAGGMYLNPAIARYRALVAQKAFAGGWGAWGVKKALYGPGIEVELLLAPPDRRARDLDNLAKVVMDALVHAGVLGDDSCRVVRRLVIEWVDPVQGGRVLATLRGHNATGV